MNENGPERVAIRTGKGSQEFTQNAPVRVGAPPVLLGGTWLSKTVRGSELARQGFGAGRQGQNAAGQAARLCQQMLAV